jgi:hypothetical protein
MLCAVSSKKTLLGLWADLKDASKTEFEAELAVAQAALASALGGSVQGNRPPRAPPRDDRPVTRLAYHLTEKLGLADREAMSALSASVVTHSSRTLGHLL